MQDTTATTMRLFHFFLIHLVSHAAPDAEIDDKQTGYHRRQHHQPGCHITDQFLGSLDNLTVLHTSGISRCGHKKKRR